MNYDQYISYTITFKNKMFIGENNTFTNINNKSISNN